MIQVLKLSSKRGAVLCLHMLGIDIRIKERTVREQRKKMEQKRWEWGGEKHKAVFLMEI